MAKVRVAVIGTVGKSVLIDTALEPRVTALETAIAALATAGVTLRHSALQGLQVGDDHPQYTMWADQETIVGTWNFSTIPLIQGETLAEYIEDVVGAEFFDFLQDTPSIKWTFFDTANELEANVDLNWAPVWTNNHTWTDGAAVRFGTDADFSIQHDGTDTLIENTEGDVHISNLTGDVDFLVAGIFGVSAGTVSLSSVAGDIGLSSSGDIDLDYTGNVNLNGVTLIEFIQDTIGAGTLVDSTSIDFTYNDGTGQIAAAVIDSYIKSITVSRYIRGASWYNASGVDAGSANTVYVRVPVTGTIAKATLLTAGGTGSCVVDVRAGTYAAFPTVASIAAAAKPTISSGIKYEDSTLTGWTTAVTAGGILAFVLQSSSTFTQISIELEIQV